MANITKHDGEEKRKSHYGVEGGVGFAVRGNAVGVYENLESTRVLI